MSVRSRSTHSRRLRQAAALLAGLGLLCACSSAGQDSSRPASSQAPVPSYFGHHKMVTVGVKKGQPGFSTRSASEYEYEGFESQLVDVLAGKLHFEAFPADIPSLEREHYLEKGGVDLMVATYSITAPREKKVDFTIPYFKTPQGILVNKDYTGIKKRPDLDGKNFCTASGSTSDPDSANDKAERRTIKRALGGDAQVGFRKDYKTCVKALKNGNYDGVWTDKVLLQGFEQADDQVKVVKDITIDNPQFYGIGLPKGHRKDCRRLNRQLREFLTDGWLDAFKSHFDKSLWGGAEAKYKPSDEDVRRQEKHSCGAAD